MSAARVLRTPRRHVLAQRVIAGVLVLSLLSGGSVRTARAEDGSGTAESKVGVLMAIVCGYALKLVLPAPVPWAGVAFAACTFAFIDAAASPDNP